MVSGAQHTSAMAKRFINRTEDVVSEAIDGLIAATPNLTRIDGYPDIKVVVRSDWEKSAGKVSVVCGGGSGHEPSFAGFVAEGFLTAAVCGNVFASPSQDAVLAAIVATTGTAGCLLVCMNYTGDRFCFGIAAARAKNEYGLDVKLLIVGDDVAIPDAKQPRGLAGTLFVLKAAGAAAASGAALASVEAEAAAVARSVRSLGVSFSSCTKPGEPSHEERMKVDEMEVGLGIHGEPGFKKMKISPAADIAKLIAESLLKTVDPKADLAVMIGNLGAVPPMEMTLFTNSLLKFMQPKLIVGPAMLMTSLDMNGIQVSICELGSGMELRLLAPTAARAWPAATVPNKPALLSMPLKAPPAKEANPARDLAIEALVKKTCEALIAATAELNELDGKVGDGDCGSTMKQSAESVLSVLGEVSSSSPAALFTAMGSRMDKVGGSSGVLLSIMFTTMAGVLAAEAKWTRESLAPAFVKGVESVMSVGGAKPGMRTMIDVLYPVAEAFKTSMPSAEIAMLANEKADATANIKSTSFGRSMYLNEETLAGLKDPGCVAAAIAIGALAA